jgi:hypothetical protein
MFGPAARGTFLRVLAALAASLALGAGEARACDLCAVYTATVMQHDKVGMWMGIAEQFTSFNTLKDGDHKIANPNAEWLQSSITQVVVGATMHPRFSLQIAIPLISREYRRFHDGEIQRGDSSGLGDISVLGFFNAFEHFGGRFAARVDLIAGLKLPTGDADFLSEELDEHDETETGSPEEAALGGKAASHHEAGEEGEESGIHGHDLALGSGSIDGVFGLTLFSSWRRLFFDGELQYLARGEGRFDYQFADDISWAGGPGAFVWLRDSHTVWLQALLTGESKGKDEQQGETLDDTAITALYLGPRLIGTFEDFLHADLGIEWPLLQHVTSVQIVPDYRLRAAFVWRF